MVQDAVTGSLELLEREKHEEPLLRSQDRRRVSIKDKYKTVNTVWLTDSRTDLS